MKIIFDTRNLARFTVLSGLSVLLSVVVLVVAHEFGSGLAFNEILDNWQLVSAMYITWVLLISLARGWIRIPR